MQSAAAPAVNRRWLFAGTFLVSLALLAFEVMTVRTINFTVGPSYIYIAIALAMLGLSGAGSILSLVNLRTLRIPRDQLLFWICLAIAALLLYSHFLAADLKADLNAAVRAAGRAEGLPGVAAAGAVGGFLSAIKVGLSLSLPYFLFGALLTLLFTSTDDSIYGRLYASDLIGAALGCVGAIVMMELTGYAMSVTAPAIAVLLGGACYAWPSNRRLGMSGIAAAVLVSVMPALGGYADRIEPPADPNYLARDYEFDDEVHEVWRGWNSFTRVGMVEWSREDAQPYGMVAQQGRPSNAYAIMSLANGDGMIWLPQYDPDNEYPWYHTPAVPALLAGPPGEVLVMFAGVGADLLSLQGHGSEKATGVELNSLIAEGAMQFDKYRTAEMHANEAIDYRISEGRVFLEQDPNRYDTILMSWSGATASYYAGALGGTTQFLYTYEAFEAILDHLKPGGHAIILQINKVNALAMLRRYMAERGIGNPERTGMVLYKAGRIDTAWDGAFDNNPLLIKPDGWTDEEIERIADNGVGHGFQVAYAPGWPENPLYRAYGRIMHAGDVDAEIAALSRENGLRFGVVTDDRPFYLDLFPNGNYFSSDFWSRVFAGEIERQDHIAHMLRIIVVALVSLFAILLIIGPLAFTRGPARTRRTFYHLAYFFSLGAGFMVLEIAIMQRASLLFGNPGITIAIVLGALILFTGLGSLLSDRVFRNGMACGPLALLAVAYSVGLGLGFDWLTHIMLPWPLLLKALGLIIVIAPGGLVLGQLFPRGLVLAQRQESALIPWAWAINGAMSTVAAGVAPLLAQAWGFQLLFFLSAGLYALILLLPAYMRSERQAGPVGSGKSAQPA